MYSRAKSVASHLREREDSSKSVINKRVTGTGALVILYLTNDGRLFREQSMSAQANTEQIPLEKGSTFTFAIVEETILKTRF